MSQFKQRIQSYLQSMHEGRLSASEQTRIDTIVLGHFRRYRLAISAREQAQIESEAKGRTLAATETFGQHPH